MVFANFLDSRSGEDANNTFIVSSQSEKLSFRTARPPSPPTNLGVIATTCTSIQLGWDIPQTHGVDAIGKTKNFIMFVVQSVKKCYCIFSA